MNRRKCKLIHDMPLSHLWSQCEIRERYNIQYRLNSWNWSSNLLSSHLGKVRITFRNVNYCFLSDMFSELPIFLPFSRFSIVFHTVLGITPGQQFIGAMSLTARQWMDSHVNWLFIILSQANMCCHIWYFILKSGFEISVFTSTRT